MRTRQETDSKELGNVGVSKLAHQSAFSHKCSCQLSHLTIEEEVKTNSRVNTFLVTKSN